MISSVLNSLKTFVQDALYILPVALISLTIHEYAHGYVAYKLGDPTAKQSGRLSLNPLRHLDPIGFIFMLFFRVGFAKPVPVNPLYFKNPKKGMLVTAIAGPASNLTLAFISSFFAAFFFYALNFLSYSKALFIAYQLFLFMALLNVGLAVFNLIPVHPFDGSRILGYFMPNGYHRFVYKYGNYIYIAFFVLLLTTDFISVAISEVQIKITQLLLDMWSVPANALAEILF